MRSLALSLALLLPTQALAAEPDLEVTDPQQVAARIGLGFGLGTQAATLTTGVLWATGAVLEAQPVLIPLSIANVPVSAAGIAGFEGILRDGTMEGYYRGLGTGFLEGGLYALGMTGVLAAGQARHDASCVGTAGNPDPCFEDISPLFMVPMIVTFASIGGAYTGIGAGMLAKSTTVAGPPPPVAVLPTMSAGPNGFRAGIVGVF